MNAGTRERLRWVQEAEAQLKGERLEIWRAVHARLPVGHPFVGTDYGLEVFLVAQIQRGAKVEDLERYIPFSTRRIERRDPKALAAGEAA